MYIKEGSLYSKHSGALVGLEDLGDINNFIAEFESQAVCESPRRPLAKCILTFMVWGLFTSIKFVYAQFPASSPKGCNIFVLVWQAIERLTRSLTTITTNLNLIMKILTAGTQGYLIYGVA